MTWLTTTQAAAILGCAASTVWRRAHLGEIPDEAQTRAGAHVRVLASWCRAQSRGQVAAAPIVPGTMSESDHAALTMGAMCA